MVLHCAATALTYPPVILGPLDIHEFIQLLGHFHQFASSFTMSTGVGNKRRIIDINAVQQDVSASVSEAVLGFCVHAGCDTTSAFMRKCSQAL